MPHPFRGVLPHSVRATALASLICAGGCTSILGGDYRAVDVAEGGGGTGGTLGGAGGLESGGGGAGGDGGQGLIGGTGGTAPLSCPDAPMGAMVRIDTPMSSYCIDPTEVTRQDYQAFVEAGVTPQFLSGQPIECAWNATYEPDHGYPPAMGEALLPVVQVDWCDALAYCEWAGKRLCGRFGGGPLDPSGATDPTESEWTHACTNAGTTAYPYGDVYAEAKCNVGYVGGALEPVLSNPECRGDVAPFAQIVDLSGNAYEWENSCGTDGGGSSSGNCLRRGGFYTGNPEDVRCDAAVLGARSMTGSTTSFRCCADLE